MPGWFLAPFLKIAVISAVFHKLGTYLSERDLLNIMVNGRLNSSLRFYIKSTKYGKTPRRTFWNFRKAIGLHMQKTLMKMKK